VTNQRVIVTGGSGFVGTNIVSFFTEWGWEVINFDIAEPRNPEHHPNWEKVDLLDRKNLIEKTTKIRPSIFLHFGARTDLDDRKDIFGYAENIEGVCNIIDAIRLTSSIERTIFASSQLVCMLGYKPRNELDYRPITGYGRSKVLFERIIRSAGDMNSIWTIVRPTSLWGPWFGIPFLQLFQLIRKNLYFHVKGENPVKQWGFIGNTVYQLLKIITARADEVHMKTFYLADYSPFELHEFANKVQRRIGSKPILEISSRLLKNIGHLGDIAQMVGWKTPPLTSFRYQNIITPEIQDLSYLYEISGPLPYSVEDGIDRTVEWMSTYRRSK
jgi:nucleoside-diphosphate-sugar epimerase